MRVTLRRTIVIALAVLALAACGRDDGTTVREIDGTGGTVTGTHTGSGTGTGTRTGTGTGTEGTATETPTG